MSPEVGVGEPIPSDFGYPVRNYTITDALYVITKVTFGVNNSDTPIIDRVREVSRDSNSTDL